MHKQITLSNHLNTELIEFCKLNETSQSKFIEVAIAMYLYYLKPKQDIPVKK